MKWQPIETVPKDTEVLVHWAEHYGLNGSTEVATLVSDGDDGDEWCSVCESHSVWMHEDPTHWMPLPEPPKGLITS